MLPLFHSAIDRAFVGVPSSPVPSMCAFRWRSTAIGGTRPTCCRPLTCWVVVA
jgi:hypothetical protein